MYNVMHTAHKYNFLPQCDKARDELCSKDTFLTFLLRLVWPKGM